MLDVSGFEDEYNKLLEICPPFIPDFKDSYQSGIKVVDAEDSKYKLLELSIPPISILSKCYIYLAAEHLERIGSRYKLKYQLLPLWGRQTRIAANYLRHSGEWEILHDIFIGEQKDRSLIDAQTPDGRLHKMLTWDISKGEVLLNSLKDDQRRNIIELLTLLEIELKDWEIYRLFKPDNLIPYQVAKKLQLLDPNECLKSFKETIQEWCETRFK